MFKSPCPLSIACMLLLSVPRLAYAQENLVVSPNYFVERENPTIKISGPLLVGAVFISKTAAKTKPVLVAVFPTEWGNETACVQGRSVDGIYESTSEYKLPQIVQPTKIGFEYPTTLLKWTKETSPSKFSMLISKGSCTDTDSVYAPSYWNIDASKAFSQVALQINSIGADEAFIFVGDDVDADPIECTRAETEKPKAFDFLCIFDKKIANKSDLLKIEINTITAGVTDDPEIIQLVTPFVQ